MAEPEPEGEDRKAFLKKVEGSVQSEQLIRDYDAGRIDSNLNYPKTFSGVEWEQVGQPEGGEFNPFKTGFDPDVSSPIVADQHGLAIMDKWEEGENMRGEGDQAADDRISSGQVRLLDNLSRYRAYKQARGEKMFSFEPEARARAKKLGEKQLAESAVTLLEADEETFNSLLDQWGDLERFKMEQSFMQDKELYRSTYAVQKLLEQSGYSKRQILSGVAEPHMRMRLNANKDEATGDAYLRWGLQQKNETKRRRAVADIAVENAMSQFLGMTVDEEAFEASMEDSKTSEEDRTMIRQVRVMQHAKMEKSFGHLRPLVRKVFNTVMQVEGGNLGRDYFREEGDEPYFHTEDVVDVLGNLPQEDFGKLTLMLAETAKAHGQDLDGFWNKIHKNMGRASEGIVMGARRTLEAQTHNRNLKRAKEGKPVYELYDAEGGMIFGQTTSESASFQDANHNIFNLGSPIMGGVYLSNSDKVYQRGLSQARKRGDLAWRTLSKEKGIARMKRPIMRKAIRDELHLWRENVARVKSQVQLDWGMEKTVDDWVYGSARSLPEMGAAALGPLGVVLVAAAQQSRNMAQIRRENPNADWSKYEAPSAVASTMYSLLNYAQFKTLTRKMPATRGFINEYGRRLALETVQESLQDLTLSTSLEMFGAIDEDIKDHDLSHEVWETIKRAPHTMFAVAPLVLMGTVGSQSIDYIGRKPIERILQDPELMAAYGITKAHQKKIRSLPLHEALDYMQKHNDVFLQKVVEMTFPSSENLPVQFSFSMEENNTFSITDGVTTVTAKSAEEAAVAAQQIRPRMVGTQEGGDTSSSTEETTSITEEDAPVLSEELSDNALLEREFPDRDTFLFAWEDGHLPEGHYVVEDEIYWHTEGQKPRLVENAKFEHTPKGKPNKVHVSEAKPRETDTGDTVKIEGGFTPLPLKVERTISNSFVDPNTTVLHSMIFPTGNSAMMGSIDPNSLRRDAARRREGLPPLPDESGRVPAIARMRYGLQTFLHQRDVPSKSLQEILDVGNRKAEGVKAQFNDIAKALDNRIKRHVNSLPRALRDTVYQQLQSDTYHALRGDNKAMAKLPKAVQKITKEGRASIDIYSQALIESGHIDKELAEVLGTNIGKYVWRQFKAHDAKSGWNYQSVKKQHTDLYQAAMKEIMANGHTDIEADKIIRGMLSKTRGRKFYSGNGTIGKVDVTSFMKKNNDLSDTMLELLGEVINPAVNIRDTGAKLAGNVITLEVQTHMAEMLVASGEASRKSNESHTQRIGEETYSYIGKDKDGNDTLIHGTRVSKAMRGFKDLYMSPELAVELEQHFNPKDGKKGSVEVVLDLFATVTGVGKFAQVILNPAAYPTNFLGGIATEIFNGRVSLDAKGARAYVKFGSFRNLGKLPNEPYGVTNQQAFYATTGFEFLRDGGVNKMGRNQLNTEMQQQGIRDNSVFAEDINQAIERGYGSEVGKASRFLSKAYQAADNAAKRSAFAHELHKWAKAEPTKTMDELVQLAASDVRSTTQNYDMVPKVIKSFSQRGIFFSTYISFGYELMRNTIGTARVASREISSGNPVLMKAGFKRVAGMAAIGAALHGLNSTVSSFMAGLNDDEREKLRSQLPPWLKDMDVVYLSADGESLSYFDASYVIPHQPFYNAVSAALREGTAGEKFSKSAKAILQPVAGGNILWNTVADMHSNKRRSGGEIYNEEVMQGEDKIAPLATYAYESMFQPGFLRTVDKIKKAKKGEIGYAGSTATMDDVYMGLVGIRPYRFDTSSPEFVKGNFSGFAYTTQGIKSSISKTKMAKMGKEEGTRSLLTPSQIEAFAVMGVKEGRNFPEGGLTPSQMKAMEGVRKAEERNSKEFNLTVRMLKQLNISDDRIWEGMNKAHVPRHLRAEAEAILESTD